MARMYQEGGLQDDGTRIEPVTGNEVPPGSMDQEVRDDIPAQLSEGEYVLPADVVRYIGLREIETLVQQAKQGLMQMEANGRIGGEPVSSTGVPLEADEELTPEEMEMLNGALGMAMGGMVPSQQAYDPYQQQQTQYTQPMFQSVRSGMQNGGMAQEPSFNPEDWRITSSGFGTTGSNVEMVEFINPATKEIRMISFMFGRPIGLVPAGFIRKSRYDEQAKESEEVGVEEVDTGTVSLPKEGEGMGGFGATGEPFGGGESAESAPQGSGESDTSGSIGPVGLGVLGGIAGLALGGPKGAIGLGRAGAKEGQDISDFGAAKSALSEAVRSDDSEAISSAEKDVEKSMSELGFIGRLATGTLGKSVTDVVSTTKSQALSTPTTATPTSITVPQDLMDEVQQAVEPSRGLGSPSGNGGGGSGGASDGPGRGGGAAESGGGWR